MHYHGSFISDIYGDTEIIYQYHTILEFIFRKS